MQKGSLWKWVFKLFLNMLSDLESLTVSGREFQRFGAALWRLSPPNNACMKGHFFNNMSVITLDSAQNLIFKMEHKNNTNV